MAKKRAKKKAPLTATRKRWADERGGATFKGNRLAHNVAIRQSYEKNITKMVERMTKKTTREIEKLFRSKEAKELFAEDASLSSQARIILNKLSKEFGLFFKDNADEVTGSMLNRIDRYSASTLGSSIEKLSGGLAVKTDFVTGEVKEVLKATTTRNVNLIKSIPQQYFEQVEDLVMRSILPGGQGLEGLKVLDKIKDKTVNRGVNIAKDQTRKAYNDLNAVRMQKAGVDKFVWIHSGGGKNPRDYHQNVLNGQEFSLNDLPVIDQRTGERGLPGQAINCKCTMQPVVTFGE